MTSSSSTHMINGDNVDAVPPSKPYTEYTIFFRLERAHILQSSGIIDDEVLSSLDPSQYDPVEFPRPLRYKHLVLPPYWYSSSDKAAIEKKRKHRKRAGRKELVTLSKTISASWRNADPVVVEYCRKLAKMELEKYIKATKGIMHGQGDKALGIEKKQDQQSSKVSQPQVPTGNDAFSFQDLIFTPNTSAPIRDNFEGHTQAKRVDAVEFTPVSANFNDSKKVKKIMPVMGAPDNSGLKICLRLKEVLRESYSGAMGYNCPPIENREQTELQMIRIRAARQQQQAAQLNMKLQLAGCNPSPNSLKSSSAPFNNGNASVSPENTPETKDERKFNRRHAPSAPLDFMGRGALQPCNTEGNGDGDSAMIEGAVGGSNASCNGNNNNALLREDDGKPKKQMKCQFKRRLSVASTPSHELEMLEEELSKRDKKKLKGVQRTTVTARDDNSKLSNSFQGELDGGMFTWVPSWKKEDAETLLDLLKTL